MQRALEEPSDALDSAFSSLRWKWFADPGFPAFSGRFSLLLAGAAVLTTQLVKPPDFFVRQLRNPCVFSGGYLSSPVNFLHPYMLYKSASSSSSPSVMCTFLVVNLALKTVIFYKVSKSTPDKREVKEVHMVHWVDQLHLKDSGFSVAYVYVYPDSSAATSGVSVRAEDGISVV